LPRTHGRKTRPLRFLMFFPIRSRILLSSLKPGSRKTILCFLPSLLFCRKPIGRNVRFRIFLAWSRETSRIPDRLCFTRTGPEAISRLKKIFNLNKRFRGFPANTFLNAWKEKVFSKSRSGRFMPASSNPVISVFPRPAKVS